MRGSAYPEISCPLCDQPVDLRVDLGADENGKAVHVDCYVKRITSTEGNPSTSLGAA